MKDQKIYEAAFKKKGRKLKWVEGSFDSEKSATQGLQSYVNNTYPNEGYKLYAGPLLKKITP